MSGYFTDFVANVMSEMNENQNEKRAHCNSLFHSVVLDYLYSLAIRLLIVSALSCNSDLLCREKKREKESANAIIDNPQRRIFMSSLFMHCDVRAKTRQLATEHRYLKRIMTEIIIK